MDSGHAKDYFPRSKYEEEDWNEDDLEMARQRKKSSGLNKVPRKTPYDFFQGLDRMDSPRFLERFPYVLDEETFNPKPNSTNEALVDNWKPIGLIVTDSFVAQHVVKLENPGKHMGLRWKRLFIL